MTAPKSACPVTNLTQFGGDPYRYPRSQDCSSASNHLREERDAQHRTPGDRHRPGDRAPDLRPQAAAGPRQASSAPACASSRTRSPARTRTTTTTTTTMRDDDRQRGRSRARAPRGRADAARGRRRPRALAALAPPTPVAPMATALRPVAHEDRLSLVEHLTELRVRIVICLVAFVRLHGVLLVAEPARAGHPQRAADRDGQGGHSDPIKQGARCDQPSRACCVTTRAVHRARRPRARTTRSCAQPARAPAPRRPSARGGSRPRSARASRSRSASASRSCRR